MLNIRKTAEYIFLFISNKKKKILKEKNVKILRETKCEGGKIRKFKYRCEVAKAAC
jgi:hypothetical protein